jgi:hypothetical protein
LKLPEQLKEIKNNAMESNTQVGAKIQNLAENQNEKLSV